MNAVSVFLLVLCYFHQTNMAGEYWVRPDLEHLEHECDCPPNQFCLTLSEYIRNSTIYFTTNVTFRFLPGSHTVTKARRVIIRGIHNMAFVADSCNLTQHMPATVNCSRNRLMFAFVEVEDLHISDLHFYNCGLEVPKELLTDFFEYFRNSTQAALLFVSVTSLVVENVFVRKSYGYGILSCNSLTVSVVGCSFHCNNWRVERIYPWVDNCADEESEDSSSEQTQLQSGGNAVFIFHELYFWTDYSISPIEVNTLKICSLNVTNSEFTYGMSLGFQFLLVDPTGGLGMHFKTRSLQQITIENCTFIGNKGANVHLYFYPPSIKTVLVINNCRFYDGESGGLRILKDVRNQEYLDASITNSKFFRNFAVKGSGLYLHINILDDVVAHKNRNYWDCLYFPQMSNSLEQTSFKQHYYVMVYIASCNFSNNTGIDGSGIFIEVLRGKIQQKSTYSVTLTVSRTVFDRNNATGRGGGFCIVARRSSGSRLDPFLDTFDFTTDGYHSKSLDGDAFISLRVVESNFTRNSATSGSALLSDISLRISVRYVLLLDLDLDFLNNTVNVAILINNSSFTENINTSIQAINTKLYLAGQVGFVGNSGHSGGAIDIKEHSFLHLNPHAQVYFINNTALQFGGGIKLATFLHLDSHAELYLINNTALYGGAIAVTTNYPSGYPCFIQVDGNISTSNAKVILMHNTAQKAGDSIYGGKLDSCSNAISLLSVFEINGTQSQSEIASEPYKVCFCPNTFTGHSCQTTSNATVFRGQTFQKAVIGSGQYGYATPAVIRISFSAGFTGELGERQSIQEVGRRCTNITLSIRTSLEFIELELSVEGSSISVPLAAAVLTVTFLPCPFGFQLTGTPPKCDCANYLKEPGVNCSIDLQLVHRPAAVWIGNYSDDVVIHSHCPFDYCSAEDNEISLHRQDEQCALNRTRVLCGACQPGLSLALGTSRCMQCSNVWILLVIVFAVAGVVLIILLLKCNLTVSTGTLNGLIFYANIIRVNHAIFFPPREMYLITQLLAVFIAWVNLDLGIETCLFDGMNAIIKTWLQFLFPIYIWVMVGLIIIVSRYSTTVSKLTGYNTVSVLATLFLLSFAKVLRTISTTLSFITLTDRYGRTSAVWLLDGNVGLLKGPHISLFIGSLLALLGLVLPYSLLLFLAPFLQGSTYYYVQKLVNKFKPLLDAYQGPYLDKFRFWTGFMLWVRIILFAVFAGNALGDPQVNLFVITLLVLVLEVLVLKAGGVYRSSGNETVEYFFLLNLGTFAASTLFLRSLRNFSIKQQEILTIIMVGSAFSVFLGILTYHSYGYLKKVGVIEWMYMHFRPRPVPQRNFELDVLSAEVNDNGDHIQAAQPTYTEIRFDQLREPLMTDN